jgi:hypothetical protein
MNCPLPMVLGGAGSNPGGGWSALGKMPKNRLVTLLILTFWFGGCGRDRTVDIPPSPERAPAVSGMRVSFADVVERVAPAVVTIRGSRARDSSKISQQRLMSLFQEANLQAECS